MKTIVSLCFVVVCSAIGYSQPLGKHSLLLEASHRSVYGTISYRYQFSSVVSIRTGFAVGEVPVRYDDIVTWTGARYVSETLIGSPLLICISVPYQQSMLDFQFGTLISWKPVQFFHSDWGSDGVPIPMVALAVSYRYALEQSPLFVSVTTSLYAPYGESPEKVFIKYPGLTYSVGLGYTFR